MNWKKIAILLRSFREARSQDKLLSKKLGDRQTRYRKKLLTGVETHEQKTLWEPVLGQENLNCN